MVQYQTFETVSPQQNSTQIKWVTIRDTVPSVSKTTLPDLRRDHQPDEWSELPTYHIHMIWPTTQSPGHWTEASIKLLIPSWLGLSFPYPWYFRDFFHPHSLLVPSCSIYRKQVLTARPRGSIYLYSTQKRRQQACGGRREPCHTLLPQLPS